MKRILIASTVLISVILVIYIFNKKIYNTEKIGNTIVKTNIQAYVLSITSYEAIADITITNGKTTNKYKIKQNENLNGGFEQVVIEPETIKRDYNKIR